RALFSCPRYPDCKGTLVTPRWTPRDRVASESAHGSATGEGNQLHRQDEQERKRKRAERKAKVEKRKREGRPVARNRGSLPSPDRVNTRQSPRRTCENCGEDYPKRWERCGSCIAEN